MAELVRLNWQKAEKGYLLETRSNADPDYGGTVFTPLLAYEIELEGPTEETFVVAHGSGQVTTPVLLESEQSTALFDLANASPTPEGVKAFAKKWGLLHRAPKGKRPELNVADFYRVSAELRGYLHLLSAGRWAEAGEKIRGASIPAGVRRFARDGVSTYIEPRSLQEFCFQDLMLVVEQRVPVLRCPAPKCSGFYAERRGRKACSDKCRKAKDRLRTRLEKSDDDEPDPARMAEIAAMWRDRCDILIAPTQKFAFVSASEMPQDGEEFLRAIAEWMQTEPRASQTSKSGRPDTPPPTPVSKMGSADAAGRPSGADRVGQGKRS